MGDHHRAAMPRRLCCVLIAAICAVSLWAADASSVERPRRASQETPESIGTRGTTQRTQTSSTGTKRTPHRTAGKQKLGAQNAHAHVCGVR